MGTVLEFPQPARTVTAVSTRDLVRALECVCVTDFVPGDKVRHRKTGETGTVASVARASDGKPPKLMVLIRGRGVIGDISRFERVPS